MALTQNPSIASLSNLVLYYDASNVKSYPGAGTSIYDMSGNNNTGTLTNGPLWSAANNGVISFDGTNDYIALPTLSLASNFTIEFWFKFSAYGGAWTGVVSNAYTQYGITIELNSSGYIILYTSSNGSTWTNTCTSASVLTTNTWYHYCGTADSGTAKIYLNGSQSGSNGTSATPIYNSQFSSPFIGKYANTGFYNGVISNIKIYNTALTAAQIKQNYDATKGRFVNTPFAPTDISGLSLWFDADDPRTLFSNTSGTTRATTDATALALWSDKSGNGRNAYQATGASQPLLKTSILNNRNVVRFDGSNDSLATAAAQVANTTTGAFTAFAVAQRATTSGALCVLNQDKDTATRCSQFVNFSSTGSVESIAFTGGVAKSAYTLSGTISANNFYLLESTADASTITSYSNGVAGSGTTTGGNLSVPSQTVTLGSYQGTGSQYLNGDIAEVLLYNSVLSSTNRIKVEQYLQNKWGVVTPFLPTQITGLQLWLDSSDSGSLFQDSAAVIPATKDGDPVGCWKDKSGNGRNATQSTTTQRPLLKTSIQNSKNILRFDGSDDYFGLSAGNYGDSLTCFIVYKWTMASTPGNAGYLYAFAGSVSPKQKLNAMYMNGAQPTYYFGERTNTAYIGNTTKDAYFVNTTTFASPYAAANLATYNNGVPLSISSFGSIGSGGATNDNVIGADKITSGIQTFTGDMAEIIVYNSVLSTAQRQQVEAYLNQKWGVF